MNYIYFFLPVGTLLDIPKVGGKVWHFLLTDCSFCLILIFIGVVGTKGFQGMSHGFKVVFLFAIFHFFCELNVPLVSESIFSPPKEA